MNPIDVAIAALCLGLALLGTFQGLVRQLASWGGIILGHLAGVRYYGEARELLKLDFRHGEVAAYLLAFLAVYLAARLAGLLVERWVRGSTLSGTDRLAGAAAGFAKGALLSVLLVFLLVVVLPRDARVFRESRLAPRAIAAAKWAQGAFPERIARSFREKIHAAETPGAGEKTPAPPPSPQPKNRSRK